MKFAIILAFFCVKYILNKSYRNLQSRCSWRVTLSVLCIVLTSCFTSRFSFLKW